MTVDEPAPPAPNVPGNTEAERMDVRKMLADPESRVFEGREEMSGIPGEEALGLPKRRS